MKKIAIHDANILIDLLSVGLFDHCLALKFQFTTTNIILDELNADQIAQINPHIKAGIFGLIEITGNELLEIQIISQEDTKLSEQDWSALYYAQKLGAILITGDKRMRNLAKNKLVDYHGILWLMDQMVEADIISGKHACIFLKNLMSVNVRLPEKDCGERIERWNK